MIHHRIAAGCLLVAVSFSSLADTLLDEAGGYLQSGEPARAWELLSPLNDQRAGDPEYDYLLGLSALDTGRYTEAIFALERVLAVDPDYSQARAELARAYFALNELDNAKQEFDRVLRDDEVPDEARDSIGSFLSAIEEAQSDQQSSFEKYISLSLGSDDNVNTGPAEASVAVPAFGGSIFTLDDNSLAQESFLH